MHVACRHGRSENELGILTPNQYHIAVAERNSNVDSAQECHPINSRAWLLDDPSALPPADIFGSLRLSAGQVRKIPCAPQDCQSNFLMYLDADERAYRDKTDYK